MASVHNLLSFLEHNDSAYESVLGLIKEKYQKEFSEKHLDDLPPEIYRKIYEHLPTTHSGQQFAWSHKKAFENYTDPIRLRLLSEWDLRSLVHNKVLKKPVNPTFVKMVGNEMRRRKLTLDQANWKRMHNVTYLKYLRELNWSGLWKVLTLSEIPIKRWKAIVCALKQAHFNLNEEYHIWELNKSKRILQVLLQVFYNHEKEVGNEGRGHRVQDFKTKVKWLYDNGVSIMEEDLELSRKNKSIVDLTNFLESLMSKRRKRGCSDRHSSSSDSESDSESPDDTESGNESDTKYNSDFSF